MPLKAWKAVGTTTKSLEWSVYELALPATSYRCAIHHETLWRSDGSGFRFRAETETAKLLCQRLVFADPSDPHPEGTWVSSGHSKSLNFDPTLVYVGLVDVMFVPKTHVDFLDWCEEIVLSPAEQLVLIAADMESA